jgi:hypothetical protein
MNLIQYRDYMSIVPNYSKPWKYSAQLFPTIWSFQNLKKLGMPKCPTPGCINGLWHLESSPRMPEDLSTGENYWPPKIRVSATKKTESMSHHMFHRCFDFDKSELDSTVAPRSLPRTKLSDLAGLPGHMAALDTEKWHEICKQMQ